VDSDAIYRGAPGSLPTTFAVLAVAMSMLTAQPFTREGKWDRKTRRTAVKARLEDDFDAARYPQTFINGKHLSEAIKLA
jgi:hypothetical protein